MKPSLPAGEQPLVGIVIVNYNCREDTALCLQSLASMRYRRWFVVLVDNASTDHDSGDLRRLALRFSAELVVLPENRGFAAGCNVGIRQARIDGADAIWLLNPDTIVHPDALGALLPNVIPQATPVLCGSKILYGPDDRGDAARLIDSPEAADEPGKIWGMGGFIDRRAHEVSMRGAGERDTGTLAEPFPCDYVPGCSILGRAETYVRVGLLDESFFLYFEETEWCVRAHERGVTLLIEPKSVVWHRSSDVKLSRPFTIYCYNRSRLRFWYRLAPARERLRMILRTIFRDLPGAWRALRRTDDPQLELTFRAHALAYWDFLTGRVAPRRF